MEIHFKIIGSLLIVLSAGHLFFPKYFKWSDELKSLSLMNRQMMYVHTFFIGLILFLMGLLCVTSSHELLNTGLGKRITLGLGVFWTIRLVVQFFGYSSRLWRGKKFETTVHVLFSIFWTYMSVIFVSAALR